MKLEVREVSYIDHDGGMGTYLVTFTGHELSLALVLETFEDDGIALADASPNKVEPELANKHMYEVIPFESLPSPARRRVLEVFSKMVA